MKPLHTTQFDVTWHAAERYAERCGVPMRDARKRLVAAMMLSGTPLKGKTHAGDVQWAIQDPDCVVVVKRELGRVVVVTVLPPVSKDELEADLGESSIAFSQDIPWTQMLDMRAAALQDKERTEVQRLLLNDRAHAREVKLQLHTLALVENRALHFLFGLLTSVAPDLEDEVIKELGFRPRPPEETAP